MEISDLEILSMVPKYAKIISLMSMIKETNLILELPSKVYFQKEK